MNREYRKESWRMLEELHQEGRWIKPYSKWEIFLVKTSTCNILYENHDFRVDK